jgi:hypothetical protein
MHAILLVEITARTLDRFFTSNVLWDQLEPRSTVLNTVNNRINDLLSNTVDVALEPYDQGNEQYFTREAQDCGGCSKRSETCTVCGGSGIEEVAFNPNGIFDWYQIGGRWQAALWEVDSTLAMFNVCKVKRLRLKLDYPQYLVTADNELVDAVESWLTNPENMDKYVILVDYHS